MIRIKFGGSGDIQNKKLEAAQDIIIRSRTVKSKLSIDSNFVMNLINEVQKHRKNKIVVEEFDPNHSESMASFNFSDSNDDINIEDIETTQIDDGDIEEIDDEIEVRKPIAPKKRRSTLEISASKYWLDSTTSRVLMGLTLLILIILTGFYVI